MQKFAKNNNFFSKKMYFEDTIDEVKYCGHLFGLGTTTLFQNGIPYDTYGMVQSVAQSVAQSVQSSMHSHNSASQSSLVNLAVNAAAAAAAANNSNLSNSQNGSNSSSTPNLTANLNGSNIDTSKFNYVKQNKNKI